MELEAIISIPSCFPNWSWCIYLYLAGIVHALLLACEAARGQQHSCTRSLVGLDQSENVIDQIESWNQRYLHSTPAGSIWNLCIASPRARNYLKIIKITIPWNKLDAGIFLHMCDALSYHRSFCWGETGINDVRHNSVWPVMAGFVTFTNNMLLTFELLHDWFKSTPFTPPILFISSFKLANSYDSHELLGCLIVRNDGKLFA